jgi:hypothetical protein
VWNTGRLVPVREGTLVALMRLLRGGRWGPATDFDEDRG